MRRAVVVVVYEDRVGVRVQRDGTIATLRGETRETRGNDVRACVRTAGLVERFTVGT